ncbi:penicillin-binding protein 1C [Novosphingobium sp.]|uniref:penicillin-binding protein 1C n=1 Tax=Novosphingobium sp. TaxID=1874826 RepID=UPI0033422772
MEQIALRSRLYRRALWVVLAAMIGAGGWALWRTTPPAVPDFVVYRQQWAPSEAWLYDRNGRLLDEARVDFTVRRLGWTRREAVSPVLRQTLINVEDRRFAWHGGVDWLALAAALRDRVTGHHRRGGSTLTMQLAGFLWDDMARPGRRSVWDKLRQMRAAWAIESRWTKPQIVEAYLNLAPFRGETQGVAAGAAALFAKPPMAIDWREAAIMVTLLRDPGAAPSDLARRACRLVPAADCAGLVPLAQAATADSGMRGMDPGLAPHLATHLLTRPGMRVTSTIDAGVQDIAATALRHQLQGLGARRARDGAVVVVDNASGNVLAYVGGVGLGSTAAAVDGAAAPRQAGSTLKPHLYAHAIERKWLTAASILDDSPVQLDTASGLYVPQNYDKAFMGPVSVRRALANSLNVPAVRALLIDGVQDFRDRLADLGYAGLDSDGGFYGYSLALGSAEVTLLDQANAYRTLANLGRWSPLRLRADDPAGETRQVIDPRAAWIVGDILSDAGARAGTFGVDSALRLPFWAAAKTGTSKAMRDNWCIGFSDRYTVAVWVGNLEGDPMRAVSGTSGAAPVWRDVMLALHADHPGHQPPRPPGLVTTMVHFQTGSEGTRPEWFLTGTAQSVIRAEPAFARPQRIANPVSGAVYAWDPDIPAGHQAIGVVISGDAAGLRLRLDDHDLGAAGTGVQMPLIPGVHVLTLIDAGGQAVDRVRFTVR